MVVVERVDQVDEALGGVAGVGRDDGDVVDEDGVEAASEREIVGGGERGLAQLGEGEAGRVEATAQRRDARSPTSRGR